MKKVQRRKIVLHLPHNLNLLAVPLYLQRELLLNALQTLEQQLEEDVPQDVTVERRPTTMNRGLYSKSPCSNERDSAHSKATGIVGDAIPQSKHEDHVHILLHNCSGFDRESNKYCVNNNL